jgi:hypothetical protein
VFLIWFVLFFVVYPILAWFYPVLR